MTHTISRPETGQRRGRASAWSTAAAVLAVLVVLAGMADAAGTLDLVRSMSLGARAHDIAIVDDLAYVAVDTGLVILDRATPGSPIVLGSLLAPAHATHYNKCPECKFLKSKGHIDQGGLGLSPGGDHLFYGGGHREFHVVDVVDPDVLHDVAFADTGDHGLGLAEIMGFASHRDHIYVAAGTGGLQVYSVPDAAE